MTSLNVELKHLIQDYLSQRAHLSVNSLANNMGVAETTLRRMCNGENKRTPSSDNIIKVLSYIYKESNLYSLKEKLPQNLREYFETEFYLQDPNQQLEIIDIDSLVSDQTSYLCYKLAANTNGVKKEEITRLFGKIGEVAVSSLIKKGILLEREGKFFTETGTFRMPDSRFVENFKSVASFIKTDPEVRNNPNLYSNFSESLNEEGLKSVRKIQLDANKKILKVMNEAKYKGDLAVFALNAIDTIS